MTAAEFLALSTTAGLSHSGQTYANASDLEAYWCVCLCVCVESVRGWDCSVQADHWRMSKPRPLSLSSQTHRHTHTHTGLWHIPQADQSIVQALQWAIAFTYIKMSLGYRDAPEDLLLSVTVHTQIHTEDTHYIHTGWRATVFCVCEDRDVEEAADHIWSTITETFCTSRDSLTFSPLWAQMKKFGPSLGPRLRESIITFRWSAT